MPSLLNGFMLFTDVSSDRAVRVFQKAGFWISKKGGKHIGMTNGRRKITIPMRGMVQSLNISVSASIFIYEISRQRLLEKHL